MLRTRTHDLDESAGPRGSAPVYRTLCGTRVRLTNSPRLLNVDSDSRGGWLHRAAPGEVPTCQRCFARLPPHLVLRAVQASAAAPRRRAS